MKISPIIKQFRIVRFKMKKGLGFVELLGENKVHRYALLLKDIFGKLRNDLSTPDTNQNSKNALISGSPVAQVNTAGVHENGVLSHSNICGDPMGINIPSFGPTE